MKMYALLVRLIISCMMCALPIAAHAQDATAAYPSRPIRLVVGFTAGGGNDSLARIFGKRLSERLGQPVVVENRPGAGATLATEFVAKSDPDGYTLLMGASGAMVINAAVAAKQRYDTLRDFAPVSMLGSFPLILIVKSTSPIKSVTDLVAFAKQNPEKANYSSASPAFQLVTEMFKKETGAPMQRVSYKGANDAVLAVISGEVTAAIADAGPVMAQVSGGVVRALAVAAPKRVRFLPDVPTMKEAGANVEAVLWSGVFAPKATPEKIVSLLQDEFMKIAREAEVVQRLSEIGIDSVGNSSADFARTVASDLEKWATAASEAGLQRMEQ